MAAVDWSIKIKGKTYYASGSSVTDRFNSPLFDDLEAYTKWIGFNPVFEYEGYEVSQDDFEKIKPVLDKLQSGTLPDEEEVRSLYGLHNLNTALREGTEPSDEEVTKKVGELDLADEFQKSYDGNIWDLFYDFFDNFSDFSQDCNLQFLKLIAWALSFEFATTGILVDDFKEVYKRNVKIVSENQYKN